MDEVKRLLLKTLYEKSFYDFVKDFWKYGDPSPFIDSELIEYYCEVFQYMARKWWDYKPQKINLKHLDGDIIDVRSENFNLNLVVPPRHSKSMIFNVLGPVWLWVLDPIEVASVSHTGALASQMNLKRYQIINSEYFKTIFPKIILTTNTSSRIMDTRGGKLYSINRDAFTGYGADVIINDDLTNAESARKDKQEMENAWSYFQNVMPSRINNVHKFFIMNIQQRLAPNDITGHILSDSNLSSKYTFITLPAIFTNKTHLIYPLSGKIKTFQKGDVLWKERFGDYEGLKYQVGETVFETQYLQNPTASNKTVIKEHLIVQKSILEVPDVESAELMYASLDFPIKDTETSDYVGVVLGYKVNQTLYITDCIEKQMAFVKSVEYVRFLADRYSGIIQVIEDKANGSPIIQQLQDEVSGIVAYNTGTRSKLQRLESASLYMESKNVIFVEDVWNEHTKQYQLSENLENLKTRLLNFPHVKYDDIVDAFSMIVLYLFLEKRNNVYLRSFNQDNLTTSFPTNLVKHYFVNYENNHLKVLRIGMDYAKQKLYVLEEYLIKKDRNSSLEELKKLVPDIKTLIDTSAQPLNNHKGLLLNVYGIKDFSKSVDDLSVLFSKKLILINDSLKYILGEIEGFKYLINKDEQVKYATEKDGFIRNIRTAVKFFGMIS